jgi:hypothetical protein
MIIELSNLRNSIWVLHDFCTFIKVCFQILHCLPYIFHKLIYFLLEFIQVFILIMVNFIDQLHIYSFEFFICLHLTANPSSIQAAPGWQALCRPRSGAVLHYDPWYLLGCCGHQLQHPLLLEHLAISTYQCANIRISHYPLSPLMSISNADTEARSLKIPWAWTLPSFWIQL